MKKKKTEPKMTNSKKRFHRGDRVIFKNLPLYSDYFRANTVYTVMTTNTDRYNKKQYCRFAERRWDRIYSEDLLPAKNPVTRKILDIKKELEAKTK